MAFEDWFIASPRVQQDAQARHHGRQNEFLSSAPDIDRSGTPLLQAVQIGGEQSQSIKMRKVLAEIAGRVAAGSLLHAAAADHTKIFPHHWIEVIRTGEVTGQMALVLRNSTSKSKTRV